MLIMGAIFLLAAGAPLHVTQAQTTSEQTKAELLEELYALLALLTSLLAQAEAEAANDTTGPDAVVVTDDLYLSDVQVTPAETALVPGDEDITIADVALLFKQGDTAVSRLTVVFDTDEDVRARDYFQSVSLVVGGAVIETASVRDNEVRISDLDISFTDSIEEEIAVQVNIADTIAETIAWEFSIADVRYTDETSGNQIDETTGDIKERLPITVYAADDATLAIETALTNPTAQTFALTDDLDTQRHEVFAFTLNAQESEFDTEISEIVLQVSSSQDQTELINELELVIDGDYFEPSYIPEDSDEDWLFDIDGELALAAGTAQTVLVIVEFEEADDITPGTTLTLAIESITFAGKTDELTATSDITSNTHSFTTASN